MEPETEEHPTSASERQQAIGQLLDDLQDAFSELDGTDGLLSSASVGASKGAPLVQRFKTGIDSLARRLHDNHLSVAVLALTKSGKSTLLNALLGQQLMPTNSTPETAGIVRIVHDPEADVPYLEEYDAEGQAVGTAEGTSNVQDRLRELNQLARSRMGSPGSNQEHSTAVYGTAASSAAGAASTDADHGSAKHQLITPATERGAVRLALDKLPTIHTRVAALMPCNGVPGVPLWATLGWASVGQQGGWVSSGEASAAASSCPDSHATIQFHLLDTPGPNEAGADLLRHQIEQLLSEVDVVLYLLDYTKLKSEDERTLFKRLHFANPSLLASLSQRLFFVVNKVDVGDTAEGMNKAEVLQHAAELVTTQIGEILSSKGEDAGGFELLPDRVLPLSALDGMMSRLVLTRQADQQAKTRFINKAFGTYGSRRQITEDELTEVAASVLQDSGLLELESKVLGFLNKQAAAVKQKAVVDDMRCLVLEAHNVATIWQTALSKNAQELADQARQLEEKLGKTVAQFDKVTSKTQGIAKAVAKEVEGSLTALQNKLVRYISTSLSELEADSRALPSGPWGRVRDAFLRILPRARKLALIDISALPPKEEPKVPAASKEEVHAMIKDLRAKLNEQIDVELNLFWSETEAKAAIRHHELLRTLEEELRQLSKQVEDVVAGALGIQLQPVRIELKRPSAAQFHANIDALLAAGVRERKETRERVREEEVVEKRKPGFCRRTQYFTVKKQVVEKIEEEVCEVDLDQVKGEFTTTITGAIKGTQQEVKDHVEKFVDNELEVARKWLQQYSNLYQEVMTTSLAASQLTAEQHGHVVQLVTVLAEALQSFNERAQELQHTLDTLVPHADL